MEALYTVRDAAMAPAFSRRWEEWSEDFLGHRTWWDPGGHMATGPSQLGWKAGATCSARPGPTCLSDGSLIRIANGEAAKGCLI